MSLEWGQLTLCLRWLITATKPRHFAVLSKMKSVQIISGQGSRLKHVRVHGLSLAEIHTVLGL